MPLYQGEESIKYNHVESERTTVQLPLVRSGSTNEPVVESTSIFKPSRSSSSRMQRTVGLFNFVTIQDNNLLPLFRLKNTPKRAENAYLSISIFKIFRGSMPPDPLEKRGLRPRVIASRSHHLLCSHLSLVTAPGPHSNPGSAAVY